MHTNSLSAHLKSPTCVRYTLKNWLRKPHNAWIKTLPPRVTWIKDFSQSQPTADDHNIFLFYGPNVKEADLRLQTPIFSTKYSKEPEGKNKFLPMFLFIHSSIGNPKPPSKFLMYKTGFRASDFSLCAPFSTTEKPTPTEWSAQNSIPDQSRPDLKPKRRFFFSRGGKNKS